MTVVIPKTIPKKFFRGLPAPRGDTSPSSLAWLETTPELAPRILAAALRDSPDSTRATNLLSKSASYLRLRPIYLP